MQSYGGGAPGTPHSAPSPGSLASQDDLYQRDVGSPGGHSWGGRVPPSPVGTPGPVSEEPVLCTHTVDIYGSVSVCVRHVYCRNQCYGSIFIENPIRIQYVLM